LLIIKYRKCHAAQPGRQVFLWKTFVPASLLETHMNFRIPVLLAIVFLQPGRLPHSFNTYDHPREGHIKISSLSPLRDTWPWFLQHLEVKELPVVDYKGRIVPDHQKAAGILSFDVGNKDLQQCADALMRLRAEYLYAQQRYDDIGFHFVNGYYYSWNEYCRGRRPYPSGNSLKWMQGKSQPLTHASLRNYLDIVYTYASTISLAKEMKNASGFETGTVVIHAGSPGHCFIIIDEKTAEDGTRLYKLAEGYTPAQSIYVLNGISHNGPWYALKKGKIETLSYVFEKYELKKFE